MHNAYGRCDVGRRLSSSDVSWLIACNLNEILKCQLQLKLKCKIASGYVNFYLFTSIKTQSLIFLLLLLLWSAMFTLPSNFSRFFFITFFAYSSSTFFSFPSAFRVVYECQCTVYTMEWLGKFLWRPLTIDDVIWGTTLELNERCIEMFVDWLHTLFNQIDLIRWHAVLLSTLDEEMMHE